MNVKVESLEPNASEEGGNEYFNTAQKIVNNAQNARESGWKAFESDKNRYWIAATNGLYKYSNKSLIFYSSEKNFKSNIINLGVKNEFIHASGNQSNSRDKAGISAKKIAARVLKKLKQRA